MCAGYLEFIYAHVLSKIAAVKRPIPIWSASTMQESRRFTSELRGVLAELIFKNWGWGRV